MNTQLVTFLIPAELHAQIKELGISMRPLVIRALEEAVKEHREAASRKV